MTVIIGDALALRGSRSPYRKFHSEVQIDKKDVPLLQSITTRKPRPKPNRQTARERQGRQYSMADNPERAPRRLRRLRLRQSMAGLRR